MAIITNYATLVTAIADFTHRSDLTPFVDYFIQGAQEMINSDILEQNEGNGIRAMEAAFTGTIASGTVAVPADWLGPKDIQVNGGNNRVVSLTFKSVTWLYSRYQDRTQSGLPAYMARDGANFIFGPFPDSGYALQGTYYALAPLLTSGAPTNWMVTLYPLMLHAACMVKAMTFLVNTEEITKWNAIYQDLLTGIINRDKAERWAMATLQVELG
jgi:hypothetical protein